MLAELRKKFWMSGDWSVDVRQFLNQHGCPKTAAHSAAVAAEARRVALLAGAAPESAAVAGWLHDISAVIPPVQRIKAARQLHIEILPEEADYPMIIHQKLSEVLAREVFLVRDAAILSAIGCHTTLRPDATLVDKVVFVADKIAWDQPGTPPYLDALLKALDVSIDHAALVYLDYLWQMRDKLRVIHPWFREAYLQLAALPHRLTCPDYVLKIYKFTVQVCASVVSRPRTHHANGVAARLTG